MKISTAFPSKYLKASDLGDKSFVLTMDKVTIVGVIVEVGNNETGAPHVWLDGRELGEPTWAKRFPTILESCRSHGVDPVTGQGNSKPTGSSGLDVATYTGVSPYGHSGNAATTSYVPRPIRIAPVQKINTSARRR